MIIVMIQLELIYQDIKRLKRLKFIKDKIRNLTDEIYHDHNNDSMWRNLSLYYERAATLYVLSSIRAIQIEHYLS